MKRRHLLAAGLGALATPSLVRADPKYPERTIRLVIPFAPAGPTDIIGRMAAEKLSPLLGRTVIVDNKAGAAGSIGAMEVVHAKPDGYTLLFATSSTHAINPTAFAKPPYDPIKDFAPISSICVNPLVLVTHPSMPPSVDGLIELMKKNPGKYSYATSGIGSILHLASEYFKREVGGMEVVHVPYKGSGPALQDLLAGNVAWMFETFSTTLQQHRAGKLRILAFAHSKRASIAPEIPTMAEAGVKGYEAYTFNLIVGPAGTPKNVVDTIDQASRKLIADPSAIKFLEDIAAVPAADTSPERTAKFIKDELAKWAPVIHAAGVKIE
ncbi:tripartite tricarboxylate transporter substrate binding protein [Reyranella sp.]|jgi:tripartite-type tricarboxylate transporter receptor subunit TctC|uniref:Bug family tripartite tricarboxylate transporter substrate binding protein n=1 Tax=Reyranella sp. TaxID=1929291 RepID=UPI002F91D546